MGATLSSPAPRHPASETPHRIAPMRRPAAAMLPLILSDRNGMRARLGPKASRTFYAIAPALQVPERSDLRKSHSAHTMDLFHAAIDGSRQAREGHAHARPIAREAHRYRDSGRA